MLRVRPGALAEFTTFDVADPDELADDSRISERFPGYNNFNTYRLLDGSPAATRPTGLLSRLAVRREGTLTLGHIESRFSTEVGIIGNGVQRLFLTFMLSGHLSSQRGEAAGSTGLIYRGLAGTQLRASEANRRITLQIDEARLLRTLEALLGEPCPEMPQFAPMVDWTDPALQPIVRLAQHLLDESADPTGLFSLPVALESTTDALTHLVLARLHHSYSERLLMPRSPAIPLHLRRAEAFIAEHAAEPIAMADVAAAAGCSLRALQQAFRRFRDTTPLGALQEARLQAVRAAMSGTDLPASEIARQFGFSNVTRFRTAYRRRFGEMR